MAKATVLPLLPLIAKTLYSPSPYAVLDQKPITPLSSNFPDITLTVFIGGCVSVVLFLHPVAEGKPFFVLEVRLLSVEETCKAGINTNNALQMPGALTV